MAEENERENGKLTPRQQMFVREYLVDLNATQAAIRAGYSPKTATEQGSRLLTLAHISDAIERAKAERARRLEISADRVLQELAVIGFAQLSDYVEITDEGIKIKPGAEVDTRVLSEVTERSRGGERTVTIKMHDKIAALDKLGRHLGLFKERLEVTGKDGVPLGQEILPQDEVQRKLIELGMLDQDGKPIENPAKKPN